MKGLTTITINQATMLTAIQQYMDTQLTTPHVVKNVKRSSNTTYSGGDEYEIELDATVEAAQQ